MRLHPSLLLTLLLLLALPLAAAQGQEPVAVFITAPDAAGVGETVEVTVTVAGGPGEEDGSFTVKAFLRGLDLTGATPVEDRPLERASQNGTFAFNITLPSVEQFVTLVVEGNSSTAETFVTSTATKQIHVLVPLVVSALVVNTGSIDIQLVKAALLINGRKVAETEINRLRPGESTTVSFSHLPVDLGVGTHRIAIQVDLNGDGIIDPAIGEVVLEDVFTIEGEPLNPIFLVLGFIGAFVAALFVGAYIRRRRRGR